MKNGDMILSDKILNYIIDWKTDENSKWIDKYIEVLMDSSNLDIKKYNNHHIIPCFIFKDEHHKNRTESQKLADNLEGNIVKLSIYNHIFAHYYLWKIFNNRDSKIAFQMMCGTKIYINLLEENELDDIAKLIEECAKENRTDKELQEWYKSHKLQLDEYRKNYREEHKDEIADYKKEWYEKNKENVLNYHIEYRKIHKKEIKEKSSQLCYDPIKKDNLTLGALRARKYRNKELYEKINPTNYIIKIK